MKQSIICKLCLIISTILISCTSNSSTGPTGIILVDSLSNSTKVTDNQTDSVFELIKKRSFNTSLDKRGEIRLIYAEKIKTISDDFKNQIDSCYKFATNTNYNVTKAIVVQKLKRYIDIIFQINPEIWMAYRKEFPILINENEFANCNADLKSLEIKTSNILSTVQNKAIVFCNEKMKF
ncbi:MAG: hypothetical protein ABIN36_05295 [Ferruginibacter sp.]